MVRLMYGSSSALLPTLKTSTDTITVFSS